MGGVGKDNNLSTTSVSPEVQERRDRSTRARNLGLPDDTLGQLASDNFDNAGLEDAIRRGWITQEQANTISDNSVKKVSIPKSQVSVNSDRWFGANGKNPTGYGNWAFYLGPERDENVIFFTGKYSDAKRQAVEEAARRGYKNITVGT